MDGQRYGKLIVLLDGASASGKSTIKNRLLADPTLNFHYVRRYTTRAPRPDDAASPDYIFMSEADFRQCALAGELLEWRHFLFGMSYGLGWPEIREGMASGKNLLAVMNLGNVREVKRQLPESVCVLVDAPLDQIERRIRARGLNTEEEIEERIGNARHAKAAADEYDFVCANHDGGGHEAFSRLRDALLCRS
jgi:guanylate kinase